MSETVYFPVELEASVSSLASLMLRKSEFCKKLDLVNFANYNIEWEQKSHTLQNCGTFIEFKDGKIHRANFCRERFCPLCQHRRSLRMYAEILKKINSMEHDYSCIHLVLTIPNCYIHDLLHEYNLLYSSSSKLFKKYPGWKGIGRFFEVTYNPESDTYHPHLHCIILVKPSYFHSRYYVSYDTVRADWASLTGVKNVQVHLSAKGEQASLIAEVAKYCTKPFSAAASDLEFHRLLQLFEFLKGKRLVQFYGLLKGLKIEDDEGLAVVDDDEHSIIPLVWDSNMKRYNLLDMSMF